MLKEKLNQDLKQAMLARDTETTDVLKGIKSAILYAEVAQKKREIGLSDEDILVVLKKESKMRQESADLFIKGGSQDKADKELREKSIVDSYLPTQMSDENVNELIDKVLSDLGITELSRQDMGRVIGEAKKRGGSEVDGSLLARLINNRIA